MNNLRKKVIAAPYPQKLNRLFSEEKIHMISSLADFIYRREIHNHGIGSVIILALAIDRLRYGKSKI